MFYVRKTYTTHFNISRVIYIVQSNTLLSTLSFPYNYVTSYIMGRLKLEHSKIVHASMSICKFASETFLE